MQPSWSDRYTRGSWQETCEAPTVAHVLLCGFPAGSWKTNQHLHLAVSQPHWKRPGEKGSQPDMSLLVTLWDTFLLVYDVFTWSLLHLSPSAPASLQSACQSWQALLFFHYSKEQQGQLVLNVFGPFPLKTRPCSSSLCLTSSHGLCLPL